MQHFYSFKRHILMFLSLTGVFFPCSDFLILPGFIDFTSDEVVSIITLSSILQVKCCILLPGAQCLLCYFLFVSDKNHSCGETLTIKFVFVLTFACKFPYS